MISRPFWDKTIQFLKALDLLLGNKNLVKRCSKDNAQSTVK